jgi:hypothetical protein
VASKQDQVSYRTKRILLVSVMLLSCEAAHFNRDGLPPPIAHLFAQCPVITETDRIKLILFCMFACRIGHLVPVWQPLIGFSFQY